MSLSRQIKPAGEEKGNVATEYRSIDLTDIRLDQSAQPRESLNTERTAEYAEAMKAGDKFPSLVVFFDGETYWLADGFHRHYAAQQAGIKALSCRILPGGLREAILWSVGANAKHGLARTDEDKRRAVLRLLNDEEWAAWSDREIARRCAVGNKFVGDVRRSVTVSEHSERTFTTKHGTTARMKTVGINTGRKNAPRPSTNDEPSPEAGPQAEASPAGTGAGTPADREGRIDGEATSVDIPTISNAERDADAIQSAWDRAGKEGRALFLSRNELTRSADDAIGAVKGAARLPDAVGVEPSSADTQSQAKASEDNGATGAAMWAPSDCMTGEVSRPDAGRSASATSERMDVTAGETAPISEKPATSSQPVQPGHSTSSPDARAPLSKPARLLRPHCLDRDSCAGYGLKHCHACLKAAGLSEAAA